MVESGNPKAIGWLSSIIAIVVALLLLHAFPLMGNWIDKQRAGEGKFEFEEDLCFDINDVQQFDNTFVRTGAVGVGANMWSYFVPPEGQQHNKISLMSFPVNGTIDGYGVWAFKPEVGDVPSPVAGVQAFFVATNITMGDILGKDVTTIDIYIDIPGATFSTMTVSALYSAPIPKALFTLGTASLGNVTKFKLDVGDLLTMNSAGLTKKFYLQFVVPTSQGINPGSAGVFDMQMYCIEEIKAPTLTRLAGWLSLMNIGVLIMVFISFPQVQVLGRFNSIGERLKKI
jgi:hypothetical protein